MIRLQTESKPPPQPSIGVVYRGLCLFRGETPRTPKYYETQKSLFLWVDKTYRLGQLLITRRRKQQ